MKIMNSRTEGSCPPQNLWVALHNKYELKLLKDLQFFPQFGLVVGFEPCEIHDFHNFSTKAGKPQLSDWIQLEDLDFVPVCSNA